jgi:uncharacterized protein
MSGVEVEHRADRKRFVARTPAGPAYVAYERPDDRTIELHHTIVPEEERGRGVGGTVVRAAIAYARDQGLRVVASCPFVRSWLDEHPDQRDVLA